MRSAGFTLIEIVLVLVLMAVAGALVYPSVQPALEAARSEAAARRTAAFLDDVRRRSVTAKKVLVVTADAEAGRLVVREEKEGGRDSAYGIPEALVIEEFAPEEARYFPQGYATGLELTLRDERRRGYRITVGPFTGLARMERTP